MGKDSPRRRATATSPHVIWKHRSGGCERRRRRPGCHRGGAPLEQRRSHGGARIPPTWVEANDEIGHGAAQSSWPATRGEGPEAAPASATSWAIVTLRSASTGSTSIDRSGTLPIQASYSTSTTS